MSDTRTNSGVDNISVFPKMRTWSVPGERVITILSAGNLATTQTVTGLLEERSKRPSNRNPSLLKAPTLFEVARLIGSTLREVIAAQDDSGPEASSTFSATLIVGGQITGMEPRLFLIYPEGNFIETSADTPFFQIGETKYGRPILLRSFERDMSFEAAVKLLMVSFDSTIKANLSVGLPLDLHAYQADTLDVGVQQRIEVDDPYFAAISDGWGDALKHAFRSLPDYTF